MPNIPEVAVTKISIDIFLLLLMERPFPNRMLNPDIFMPMGPKMRFADA